MKIITLKTTHFLPEGTFSVMDDDGQPFAATAEPPMSQFLKTGEPKRFLLPFQEFSCKEILSPKFGRTFEILVDGHTKVEFHWGNSYKDTTACVIVAEKFGILNGITAVLESRNVPNEGFNEFLKRTAGLKEFKLVKLDCSNQWKR